MDNYEKKYKEALEWARKVMQGKVGFVLDEVLEKFPELKEGEDKRIRDMIFNCVYQCCDDGFISVEQRNNAISWLEAQGEHANFCNKIQIGDKVTRNEDGVLVNISQLKRVAKKDEKQGEQKSYISETMEGKHDFDSGFTKMMEKEQNPAWSEEDETKLNDAIDACKAQYGNMSYTADWLLSIKDRVQPQPKKEWSNEDESNINDIRGIIYENCRTEDASRLIEWLMSLKPQPQQEWSKKDKEKIARIASILGEASSEHAFMSTKRLLGDKECIELQDWLKSLRPQPQWKPSDEQMKALEHAINCYSGISPTNTEEVYTLEIMKEQLKKLKS